MENYFRQMCTFDAGHERAKGYGRINEASLKRIQDHVLDVVDPTANIHAQYPQIYLATDPHCVICKKKLQRN